MRPGDAEFAARINAYDLAFKMQTEAPGDLRSRRASRARRSSCTASARSRPTITAGAACWRAGWSRRACASSASSPAAVRATCSGTRTRTSRRTTSRMAAQTDQPVAALLKDLKRAACSIRRWSSGAASSAARRKRKAARAATITTSASRCGWPAAASRAARWSARPTPSACAPSRSRYHFRDIHTTILHQLGLDQDALSYLHQGRKERLTEVHGKVIRADRVIALRAWLARRRQSMRCGVDTRSSQSILNFPEPLPPTQRASRAPSLSRKIAQRAAGPPPQAAPAMAHRQRSVIAPAWLRRPPGRTATLHRRRARHRLNARARSRHARRPALRAPAIRNPRMWMDTRTQTRRRRDRKASRAKSSR